MALNKMHIAIIVVVAVLVVSIIFLFPKQELSEEQAYLKITTVFESSGIKFEELNSGSLPEKSRIEQAKQEMKKLNQELAGYAKSNARDSAIDASETYLSWLELLELSLGLEEKTTELEEQELSEENICSQAGLLKEIVSLSEQIVSKSEELNLSIELLEENYPDLAESLEIEKIKVNLGTLEDSSEQIKEAGELVEAIC